MFQTQGTTGHLPGYTGHIPSGFQEEEGIGRETRSHIPGYQGYIPSVTSENLFGTTYGKITGISATQQFPKGPDHAPKDKYVSMARQQHVDLSTVQERTATEILGVQPRDEKPATVIPVATLNAFLGEDDEEVQYNRNKELFFTNAGEYQPPPPQGQDFEENRRKFFNLEKKEKPVKHGMPVPGYTGVVRRVEANNIFGVTYANSIKNSKEDLREKKQEEGFILQQRAMFTPDYRR